MTDWYSWTMAALVLLGSQRFLYKTAAEKNCDTVITTFAFFLTVAVLSLIFFVASGSEINDPLFLTLVSLINSSSFTVATLAHIESLRYVPAAESYTIIRLNVVLVVLFSVFYFNDQLSVYQILGVMLALAVIGILTNRKSGRRDIRDSKRGFTLIFISLISGAAAAISSKFAAVGADKFAFISLTYILSSIFSYLLKNRIFKRAASGDLKMSIKIGGLMGFLNIGGYYAFLKALEIGPLSVIATITGMHFVVAVVLSALIYKEKINKRRSIGVLLAAASVILLRL